MCTSSVGTTRRFKLVVLAPNRRGKAGRVFLEAAPNFKRVDHRAVHQTARLSARADRLQIADRRFGPFPLGMHGKADTLFLPRQELVYVEKASDRRGDSPGPGAIYIPYLLVTVAQ